MKGFFDSVGMHVGVWDMALWGIPTAISAFSWIRFRRFDKYIENNEGRRKKRRRQFNMNIITMDTIYYVLGIIVAFIAVRIAFDREHPNRFGSSLFWALFAVTFLFGNVIPSFYVGCIVLAMVVLASLNKVTKSEEKEEYKNV